MARRRRSKEQRILVPEDRAPDLVCFSHLRWNFVFQRPQHLLTRCARERRAFYVEEPRVEEGATRLEVTRDPSGVMVAVPYLSKELDHADTIAAHKAMIDGLFAEYDIRHYILWYYTPMVLHVTHHLKPLLTVYDCMDELSAFKNAPQIMKEREEELFRLADLVFTGGASLYEAKRALHPNVYLFPSSIDVEHFHRARTTVEEPVDQGWIPHPRVGYYGVIDERMDLDLLAGIANARPSWHLVVIGPVAKIGLSALPRRDNIYYLGNKPYQELPDYLAGWDVALLPFALNDSTRFISPTKTPEYLTGGKPVVSSPIRDVIHPYGDQGLVQIASGTSEFVAAIEGALDRGKDEEWLRRVDAFLAKTSWNSTWEQMRSLIESALAVRRAKAPMQALAHHPNEHPAPDDRVNKTRAPLSRIILDKGQNKTAFKPS